MLYISKGLKTLVQALFIPWRRVAILRTLEQKCWCFNGVTQVACTVGAQQVHENRGVCVKCGPLDMLLYLLMLLHLMDVSHSCFHQKQHNSKKKRKAWPTKIYI